MTIVMIDARDFLTFLLENGFSFGTGVPCSYFAPLLNELGELDSVKYVPATREDEAVGIASGVALGGGRAFIVMQNSGYATIGDALTSLAQLYKLPMLLIVSYRGLKPDNGFPEHSLMGELTEDALECYRVPFWNLEEKGWRQTLEKAIVKLEETSRPVALIVRKGVVG
ncbi:MAG: thiamine pyrophosphate-binding protein [Candidatus Thorarchaeota archaeon]